MDITDLMESPYSILTLVFSAFAWVMFSDTVEDVVSSFSAEQKGLILAVLLFLSLVMWASLDADRGGGSR